MGSHKPTRAAHDIPFFYPIFCYIIGTTRQPCAAHIYPLFFFSFGCKAASLFLLASSFLSTLNSLLLPPLIRSAPSLLHHLLRLLHQTRQQPRFLPAAAFGSFLQLIFGPCCCHLPAADDRTNSHQPLPFSLLFSFGQQKDYRQQPFPFCFRSTPPFPSSASLRLQQPDPTTFPPSSLLLSDYSSSLQPAATFGCPLLHPTATTESPPATACIGQQQPAAMAAVHDSFQQPPRCPETFVSFSATTTIIPSSLSRQVN